MVYPDVDVSAVPREDLPALLGRLVELEARVRLRLADSPAATPARLLTAPEAAALAGTSTRWLNSRTRGLALRRDLSRKAVRYDERALRAFLADRTRQKEK